MAGFDYLRTTTYDPQLEDQQEQVENMLASQEAAQTNDPNDLQELNDDDLGDLVEQQNDEHEEISDSDADKMSPDVHDFENEELDDVDYQLMGYLMGDPSSQQASPSKPQMQAGGGTYGDASTIYGPGSGLDNNTLSKINNIKFASLNPTSKYNFQASTANGQAAQNTYQSIQNTASNIIKNDPIAKQMGIDIAKTGGYTSSSYQVGGRYTFPGMKMPRKKYQTGGQGDILYANDDTTKRYGLNDQNYQRAILNLKGTNMIRGLDNGQPVSVTDGKKHKVLYGPHDTDHFTGKVYEKTL